MNINDAVLHFNLSNKMAEAADIKTLDEIASKEVILPNFGFLIMYEEWKQNILLSNGINDDENADW
ncbi:hypothetical protein KC222_00640 [Cedecea davisae]|uniref:Uncharacterized protein n=1 Tax=Cedecea davisae TaxID=158484 RepID=A0ABS6DCD2_9ENTR|nr:hypothetical protein [Cedecea davisae]MBU4680519.1 hypothetical protein [Cedecea davisae]MBU4685011.1 hypothetical protein [Cedecea davisae]